MAKQLKSARIGIYECNLDGNFVLKGKWVKGYYGLFSNDIIDSRILPDLQEARRAGRDFNFPVLIMSWILGKGNSPKPLPRPQGRLFASKVGGIRNLKRMVGVPIRRKRVECSEKWEAVIDEEGQVLEFENNRVKSS